MSNRNYGGRLNPRLADLEDYHIRNRDPKTDRLGPFEVNENFSRLAEAIIAKGHPPTPAEIEAYRAEKLAKPHPHQQLADQQLRALVKAIRQSRNKK